MAKKLNWVPIAVAGAGIVGAWWLYSSGTLSSILGGMQMQDMKMKKMRNKMMMSTNIGMAGYRSFQAGYNPNL